MTPDTATPVPPWLGDMDPATYAHIRRLVDAAPPLTAEQRITIAALLGGPKRDAA